VYHLPIETATRIFDLFLYEGEQVMYRIALNILCLNRDKILALTSYDLMGYMCNELVRDAFATHSIEKLLDWIPKSTMDSSKVGCK
jgi:hypothetical protein